MVRPERTGMALPFVLLLLLGLAAFGHAALRLSMGELKATWAFRSLVRAETASQIGLRVALDLPLDPFADRELWVPQPVVSGETEDGLIYTVSRRWLSEEFFMLESTGGTEGWPGQRKVGWIGWTLYPGMRLKAFLAYAEVGSDVVEDGLASLEADSFSHLPEGWGPSACRFHLPLLDSLSGLGPPLPAAKGTALEGEGYEATSSPLASASSLATSCSGEQKNLERAI